jgi:hypothetical protein
MMNPDLQDPNWMEIREQQWVAKEKVWKREVNRESLKALKSYFFGGDFEYGNSEKHGDEIATNIQLPFFYHPVQTPERWTQFINKLFEHRWYNSNDRKPIYLPIFKFLSDPCVNFNWDLDTALEFHQFVYGDKFIEDSYEFMGYTSPYPLTRFDVAKSFLTETRLWINGVRNTNDDTVGCYYYDWFVEALEYLPSIYFETYRSRDREIASKQHVFTGFLFTLVYSKYDKSIKSNRRLSKAGRKNRLAFCEKMFDFFLSSDTSPMFNQTIELLEKGFENEGDDYEIPRSTYMPEERDVENPRDY